MSKQHTNASRLGVIALILGLVIATPAYALDPNLDFTGGCPQGLLPITDGCLIAGTYTDASGNDFRIDNASVTNPARVQWVEGSINKLILTGATVVALENVSNATLTFRRSFTSSASFMTTSSASFSARNSFSGGFNLLYPNQTTRTDTAEAFLELCTVGIGDTGGSPTCTTGGNGIELNPLPISPADDSDLVGLVASGLTVKTFTPTPKQQDSLTTSGSDSKPLLRGKIVISSLRNSEKTSNLTQTVLIGASSSLPPFDSGPCDGDEDIGKINRGPATDGSQDTICVRLQDGGYQQMSGLEALSYVGTPQCPTIPGEAHRPQ